MDIQERIGRATEDSLTIGSDITGQARTKATMFHLDSTELPIVPYLPLLTVTIIEVKNV